MALSRVAPWDLVRDTASSQLFTGSFFSDKLYVKRLKKGLLSCPWEGLNEEEKGGQAMEKLTRRSRSRSAERRPQWAAADEQPAATNRQDCVRLQKEEAADGDVPAARCQASEGRSSHLRRQPERRGPLSAPPVVRRSCSRVSLRIDSELVVVAASRRPPSPSSSSSDWLWATYFEAAPFPRIRVWWAEEKKREPRHSCGMNSTWNTCEVTANRLEFLATASGSGLRELA